MQASALKELATGVWHHVAFTYDGERLRLYLNGVSAGSARFSNVLNGNSQVPLRIGQYGGTAIGYFQGVIDEVKICDLAKTFDQIAAEYNSQRS